MVRTNAWQYISTSLIATQFNLFVFALLYSPVQSAVLTGGKAIELVTVLSQLGGKTLLLSALFTVLYVQYLLGMYLSFRRFGPDRTYLSNIIALFLSGTPIITFVSVLAYTTVLGTVSMTFLQTVTGTVVTTGACLTYLYAGFARFDIPFGWNDPATPTDGAIPYFLKRLFR